MPGDAERPLHLHGGLSIGPKTAEGIERIRKAQTKHGWYSQKAVARRGESRRIQRRYPTPVGLPYRTILSLACVVLATRYIFDSTEPRSWRWAVGIVTAVSFVLPDGLAWYAAGVVLQLAVSLFALFRRIMGQQ